MLLKDLFLLNLSKKVDENKLFNEKLLADSFFDWNY